MDFHNQSCSITVYWCSGFKFNLIGNICFILFTSNCEIVILKFHRITFRFKYSGKYSQVVYVNLCEYLNCKSSLWNANNKSEMK